MVTKRKSLLLLAVLAATCGIVAGAVWWHEAEESESPRRLGFVAKGILRSAQPDDEQLDRIRRHGDIRSVISLREANPESAWESAERAWCERNGVQFLQVPIAVDLPSDDQVVQFLRYLQPANRPLLIHCELGRSRTGKMVAAFRIILQDGTPEAALAEMKRFGFEAEPDKEQEVRYWLERLAQHRADFRRAALDKR